MRLGTLPGTALALAAGVALWEGYKAVGAADGATLFGVRLLPRTDDAAMPHAVDVLRRLGEPEVAGGRPVWRVVADAGLFTLGVTAVGLAVGALVGLLLAVVMQRFRTAERGLLPWVGLCQVVPLMALAPLLGGWAGAVSVGPFAWRSWMSVSLVAAYLAIFPVAVGALRGLRSPPAVVVDLMRSYAAGWWRTLVMLRMPAATPYLFPALRLAGAVAVAGAVVGEVSTGTRGGIGRLVVEYSREATTDPAKVYTALLGAALVGLVVAAAVALVEWPLTRHRRRVPVP